MNGIPRPLRPGTLLLAATSIAAFSPAYAASPLGVWLDNSGRGAVEIKQCGSALCGHVVWVKDTSDAKGCGRQIIGDATASGGKYNGWIYSPEDRKRYNVEFSTTGDGRLKVVGYAGIRLFSKTMYWKAAAPDLVRCDAPAAKPKPEVVAATPPPSAPAAPKTEPAPTPAKAPEQSAEKAPAITPPASPAATGTTTATKPAAPEAKAPSAAANSAPAPETAAADQADEPNTAEGGEEASGDQPGLEKLAEVVGKVVKRTPGGGCKLDLPWVKVEFRCEE